MTIFVSNIGMMSSGKWIVMVEDDLDMHYLYERVFKNLHLQESLKLFDNAKEALSFLRSSGTDISIIFSDVNMPMIDGIELKRKINEDPSLSIPSIPFVFLSTSATESDVEKTSDLGVQGFFQKGETLNEIEQTFRLALNHWK